ncbi:MULTISPECIES: VOC family protein [unclassified Devosia]|uniref:VOC family protein n=1 Tax=unclassified Devosia TaxID=196773 RepID=UPI000FD81439|nr:MULTISPECIES: VOC family protein [unclassified Devosia]
MLKQKDSSAIVAVSDIARAQHFYGTILGLELEGGDDDVLTFRTGGTRLVVYRSDYAGTNQANAVVWGVGDELEAITADLAAKGVVFEHYPGMELRGDIHHAGDFGMVWFKDPDGNILHLNTM